MGEPDDTGARWRYERQQDERLDSVEKDIVKMQTQLEERANRRAEIDAANDRRFKRIEETQAEQADDIGALKGAVMFIPRGIKYFGWAALGVAAVSGLFAPSIRDVIFRFLGWE